MSNNLNPPPTDQEIAIPAPEQPPPLRTNSIIPDYLLSDILAHLDIFSLLPCRSVCRFWKWNLENRTRLRQILYTQPPPPAHTTQPAAKVSLHPVLRMLDYHFHAMMYFRDPASPIKPLAARLDFRTSPHPPAASPAMRNFATSPAARTVVVKMCGARRIAARDAGVSVWDLMECFDSLIRERHCLSDAVPARYRLAWDHRQYPFAGFCVSFAKAGRVVLTPEFHNLPAVTRQLSGCRPRAEPLLIIFSGGGGEEEEEEGVDDGVQ